MKKAVVFIANGSEEIEALTPVDYLRRAGVDVRVVSAGGHAAELGGGAHLVECSHGVQVVADGGTADGLSALSDADLPDAVVVPGGMPGSTNIAGDAAAVAFVRRMDKAGRMVCAICAAPAVVLPATGALDGKAWTCYPGMEAQAGAAASRHKAGVPFVHDANLITGRGPGAAEEFSMEIVRTLCGDQTADKIRAASCQR